MKALFTILVTAFTALSGYAYWDQTKLTISSTNNATIRIMVDGQKYTHRNGDFALNNLTPGYHTVKIYVQKRNQQQGQWGNSNSYQLVYNNSINMKPQYHVDMTVNRFGKVFTDEQLITNQYYADDDWSDNNGGGGYMQAMNTQVFEQFKQSLKNESFDNTRLTVAKQVINNNWFTAVQVKEIVKLFTFETSKLDIAKYAYTHTVDRGSYFIVNDAFTFSNTKDELMKYIQTVK